MMKASWMIQDRQFLSRKSVGFTYEIPADRYADIIIASSDPWSYRLTQEFKDWVVDKGPYRVRPYANDPQIIFARKDSAMMAKLRF